MQVRIQPNRETDNHNSSNYKFMYEFRCTPCCKVPGKCTMTKETCFYSHNTQTHRRVPFIQDNGLYNYIPEECTSWKQHQKCSRGENCRRAHGWLEVIFHPLLYKTKLCDHRKNANGLCSGFAIHCAKAHNTHEIRNLKKIFGMEWKRHYDLTRTQFEDPSDKQNAKADPAGRGRPRGQSQTSDRFRRPAALEEKSQQVEWVRFGANMRKRKSIQGDQAQEGANWRARMCAANEGSADSSERPAPQRKSMRPWRPKSLTCEPMVVVEGGGGSASTPPANELKKQDYCSETDVKSPSSVESVALSPKFVPRVLSDNEESPVTVASSATVTSSGGLKDCLKLRRVVAMGLQKKQQKKRSSSDASLRMTPTKKLSTTMKMPLTSIDNGITPKLMTPSKTPILGFRASRRDPLDCPISPFASDSNAYNLRVQQLMAKKDGSKINPLIKKFGKQGQSNPSGPESEENLAMANMFTKKIWAHVLKNAENGDKEALSLLETSEMFPGMNPLMRGKNKNPESVISPKVCVSDQMKSYQTPNGYYMKNLPPAAYNLLTPEKSPDWDGAMPLNMAPHDMFGHAAPKKSWLSPVSPELLDLKSSNELLKAGMLEFKSRRPAGAPIDEQYADEEWNPSKRAKNPLPIFNKESLAARTVGMAKEASCGGDDMAFVPPVNVNYF